MRERAGQPRGGGALCLFLRRRVGVMDPAAGGEWVAVFNCPPYTARRKPLVYSLATLNKPDPILSRKLSRVGSG